MPEPEPVPAGAQVQIVFTVLAPSERAEGLPPDTAALPYLARGRGALLAAARPGEEVEIETQAGRRISGTLELAEPADTHSFGAAPPQLVFTQRAIARLLDEV
ncbi:MAG: hypothetical protein JSS68_12745 [Actinobacteria bacterium]|nr:hypothetical protein [Actinomycetota bacterium]